jgi:hypothetical protein
MNYVCIVKALGICDVIYASVTNISEFAEVFVARKATELGVTGYGYIRNFEHILTL